MKPVLFPRLKEILSWNAATNSQKAIADRCGVSQTAVHKWLNGYSRPRRSNLAALADFLEMEPRELAGAAGYAPEDIEPLYEGRFDYMSEILSYADINFRGIRQVRVRGEPQLALRMATDLYRWLKGFGHRTQPPAFVPKLSEIGIQILFEQALAYMEICLPWEIWQVVQPIANEMEELAGRFRIDEGRHLAELCKADAYYVLGDYKRSLKLFADALPFERIKHPEYQAVFYRTAALDCAYLNDKRRFEYIHARIRRLLDDGHITHLEVYGEVLEGLGRAQGVLGLPSALKTLESAQDIYVEFQRRDGKAPFLAVQIARSQLVTMERFGRHDKQSFEKIGQEGLRVAHEYGYKRHARSIEQLLRQYLD